MFTYFHFNGSRNIVINSDHFCFFLFNCAWIQIIYTLPLPPQLALCDIGDAKSLLRFSLAFTIWSSFDVFAAAINSDVSRAALEPGIRFSRDDIICRVG